MAGNPRNLARRHRVHAGRRYDHQPRGEMDLHRPVARVPRRRAVRAARHSFVMALEKGWLAYIASFADPDTAAASGSR